jgi:hypothetical protein
MADAVTAQTLFDDGGNVVIHLTNVSDGTGESAVVKVDASALVGGATTTRYALEAIAWATVGMGFNLLWDADTDVLFFTTGNTTSQGFIDYLNGTGKNVGSSPGRTGITNNAGTGITGDVRLTTVGHTSGDSYVVTLWLRKTVA